MTTPQGVLFSTLFKGDEDLVRHVLYQSWLWRDWDYDKTSLTGFSPFASDGNFVDTFFDDDQPGGRWHDVGYVPAKGVDFNFKLNTKPTKVAQTRWPVRWDYTEESIEVSTSLQESNPVVDALRDGWLLNGPSRPQLGQPGYTSPSPQGREILYRQCLLLGVDGYTGKQYNIAVLMPRVVITDFGRSVWGPDDVDALPIKAQCIPDPYSVFTNVHDPSGTLTASPRIIMRDGPGWRAKAGVLWPAAAPVATAGASSGQASVVFTPPSGGTPPYTYVVYATTGAITSQATQSGAPSGTSSITASVTGLTSGDSYTFQIGATDTNGNESPNSAASNSIVAP